MGFILSPSGIIQIWFRTFPSIFSNDQGTVRRYPVSCKRNDVKATFCYGADVWCGCPWILGGGGYPGESIKWPHGRLAWCVLTAPRAVNTRAQNEYASCITHDVHVESLFLFSMISVSTHHASRITLHASRVCGFIILVFRADVSQHWHSITLLHIRFHETRVRLFFNMFNVTNIILFFFMHILTHYVITRFLRFPEGLFCYMQ